METPIKGAASESLSAADINDPNATTSAAPGASALPVSLRTNPDPND